MPVLRRLAIFSLCLSALWLAVSEWGLSSLSDELIRETARSYVLSSVSRAVERELKGRGGFVSVSRSGNGGVSAVSVDTEQLNSLRTGVLDRLSKTLNGKATAFVPIGSLTGSGVFNGRGPKVPIKLKLESSADVFFRTEFLSAGVNQTCHRITMTVRVSAFSQSRRFETRTEEETVTVLAETVVVGQVPDVALASAKIQ